MRSTELRARSCTCLRRSSGEDAGAGSASSTGVSPSSNASRSSTIARDSSSLRRSSSARSSDSASTGGTGSATGAGGASRRSARSAKAPATPSPPSTQATRFRTRRPMLHCPLFLPRFAPSVPRAAPAGGADSDRGKEVLGDVNDYELMLILDPELAEERQSEIVTRMRELIERSEGKWLTHDAWGR